MPSHPPDIWNAIANVLLHPRCEQFLFMLVALLLIVISPLVELRMLKLVASFGMLTASGLVLASVFVGRQSPASPNTDFATTDNATNPNDLAAAGMAAVNRTDET